MTGTPSADRTPIAFATSSNGDGAVEPRRVLLIGAGGLGCAAAIALARSGARLALTIVDPDRIEESNLHRQVLYGPGDLGVPKALRAAERIRATGRGAIETRAIEGRFDVASAPALVREHDLVIEGTDRHEIKFLAADACVIARVPVIHAGVVRWAGWVLITVPFASACLRCVFEDVPRNAMLATCASDGVVGSVVGTLGAIQAALAMRVLAGEEHPGGTLFRYDGLAGTARSSRPQRREDCVLCGLSPAIRQLETERYAPACSP
jgi:adenylyltransferase/sulfurtransferase